MAITRTQIAKQLLAQGGRTGFQGGGADMGKERGPETGRAPGPVGGGGGGRDPSKQFEGVRPTNIVDEVALTSSANKNFMKDARDAVTPIGDRLFRNVPFSGGIIGGLVKGALNLFSPSPFGFSSPKPVDFSGMDRGGDIPLWAQLGFSSEAEYLAALARTQAPSTTEQEPEVEEPFQLARRFRAEGGIMNSDVVGGEFDFESARQMYGLGKLVKKVTRTVKKIAKSPIGKAAIVAAGGYYLGGGNLFGLQRTGMSGFKFANLPGAGLFAKSTPVKLAAGVPDRLAFNAARTAAGTGASGGLGIGTLIAGTSLLAGLLTPEQEEEAQALSRGEGIDIEAARRSILNAGTAQDFRARRFRAEGGRIGYDEAGAVMSKEEMEKLAKSPLYKGFKKMYNVDPNMAKGNESYKNKFSTFEQLIKKGYQKGGDVEPVAKKTMPLLDMGGQEMDLRAEGGFVPIGRMEKADDVPARLSKNEFVFTADAVRNAGDGDVDKGAEVMYNMMKNLEAGGDVSEESQGLEGARKMFQTSQRLEEVL